MRVKIVTPKSELLEVKKLKVCAYARVSSDSLKQEDSLENQTSTYERLISSNPDYEFAGVYADQGISGYCENRPAFQSMLEKAKNHEIDLIITKSVSRFARNTVTVLKVARELKELGIGIFFEEQNINTLSGDGEMMLAVLASFAQEESRSMSENNKWTMKKKFERGEIMVNTTRFMGYDKNEFGELVINREQAKIVRRIFDMYLSGIGMFRIAALLNDENVPTITGGKWYEGTIRGMLKNEKYKGDCILQKYYTPENRRNTSVRNNGEVQSYYIEENHPAIVSKAEWDKVQQIMQRHKEQRKIAADGTDKYKNRYPLSGILICPYCGKALRRKQVYNKRIEWWCSTYIHDGKTACKGVKISDEEASKQNITEPTVVEEVKINGEKYYSYTSKEEFDRGIRNKPSDRPNKDGGILPRIHRPRRTAIKL
ncbi:MULTISPECIES: recombinase family protein [Sporomusaceae]|uniref:Site-specific DNA recombinase n=1 Tax=Propionispora hippei DSM 15287 TaxID=1123003 RepID=A0A1M6GMK2_9FIRM|nr:MULTISPECIES: recombinase family protein [Sporomusaceae]SHJ11161.1 Site-specific DNA recombinase [Propionispora hippei DSM 15287]